MCGGFCYSQVNSMLIGCDSQPQGPQALRGDWRTGGMHFQGEGGWSKRGLASPEGSWG